MNVCVYGLWHLGTVTAACLASGGHHVVAIDADSAVVDRLSRGIQVVSEPGLEALLTEGLESGRLRFSSDLGAAATADVLWITHDTPVDDNDNADVESVVRAIEAVLPYLRDGALVMISSQVPVGTTARAERAFREVAAGRRVGFVYSPENLRLGSAIAAFTRPERVVAGARSLADREIVGALLRPFTDRIEWMSVESAEMTKHALNAFLATSVPFINEVATLCEQVGADASEVQRGLQSDVRIGPRAYLSPGAAFAGGTLAREVSFLSQLGERHGVATHLISSVRTSNAAHGRWAERRLAELFDSLAGQPIAVWGLTYKPGTTTLRRSAAVELCRWLIDQGAVVRAHDPAIEQWPADQGGAIPLGAGPLDVVAGAAALVVATPWPDYRKVDADTLAERMSGQLVLYSGGFLADTLGRHSRFTYLRVGQPIS